MSNPTYSQAARSHQFFRTITFAMVGSRCEGVTTGSHHPSVQHAFSVGGLQTAVVQNSAI